MLLSVGGNSTEAVPSTAPDYIPEGPTGHEQTCEAQGSRGSGTACFHTYKSGPTIYRAALSHSQC